MTTMGADKNDTPITLTDVERKPGETITNWYNRITPIIAGVSFKDLAPEVKKYILYRKEFIEDKPKLAENVNLQFQEFADTMDVDLNDIDPVMEQTMKRFYEKRFIQEMKDRKEMDQSIKADAGKAELRLVPMAIMYAIASIRTYGNKKYSDPDSWKRVAPERYIDAMLRHATAFAEDPLSKDEESGLPHLHHLACNVAFLCDMYKEELK